MNYRQKNLIMQPFISCKKLSTGYQNYSIVFTKFEFRAKFSSFKFENYALYLMKV